MVKCYFDWFAFLGENMKLVRNCFDGKLFDSHTHCSGIDIYNYLSYRYPVVQDIETLEHILHINGIDGSIVFPVAFTLYYDLNFIINKKVFKSSGLCAYPFEVENRYLFKSLEFCSKNKYFLPFACISLNDKINEQIEALTEYVANSYLYGIKYHTMTDGHSAIDLLNYPQLIKFIRENDLPIVLHSGKTEESNPIAMLDFADEQPDIRICVAHMGRFKQEFFNRLDIKSYKNVFFDIAPFSFLCDRYNSDLNKNDMIKLPSSNIHEIIEFLVGKYPDKILWGSDLPWVNTGELSSSVYASRADLYAREVCLLKTLPLEIQYRIASVNTLDFVFGRD